MPPADLNLTLDSMFLTNIARVCTEDSIHWMHFSFRSATKPDIGHALFELKTLCTYDEEDTEGDNDDGDTHNDDDDASWDRPLAAGLSRPRKRLMPAH